MLAAMFATALTSQDESMKLLLLLIIAGFFVLLARWASSSTSAVTGEKPSPDSDEALPEESSFTWGPSAEEVAASFPADPLLGKIQIRKFYFAKTEARPGPDDPDVFADELFVQLYDSDTNWLWWQSYFVVTPKGLANVLKEKHWKYLHVPQLLAVPRYDLEEIRRAVVSRVVADHEYYKGMEQREQVEEETLDGGA